MSVTEIDSIRRVFDLADDIDRREGKLSWYRYNTLMQKLADHYSLDLETMTALFVATSPNNDYIKNLRSAVSLAAGFRAGLSFDEITISTYRACGKRAWRCLHGEKFLDFTKGLKTRSFYLNILDPNDPDPITIDGHMIAIWKGRYLRMHEAVRFTGHYVAICDAIRVVADENGLIPNQLQTILWFTWKRIHQAVKNDGQMNLFMPADHWGLCLEPDQIKPFQFNPISIHRRREMRREDRISHHPALFKL